MLIVLLEHRVRHFDFFFGVIQAGSVNPEVSIEIKLPEHFRDSWILALGRPLRVQNVLCVIGTRIWNCTDPHLFISVDRVLFTCR